MLFSKVSSSKALGFKMKTPFWYLGIVFRVKLQSKRSAVYDEAPLLFRQECICTLVYVASRKFCLLHVLMSFYSCNMHLCI